MTLALIFFPFSQPLYPSPSPCEAAYPHFQASRLRSSGNIGYTTPRCPSYPKHPQTSTPAPSAPSPLTQAFDTNSLGSPRVTVPLTTPPPRSFRIATVRSTRSTQTL